MIEAGAPDLDLLVGQAHDAGDVALSHENAVAQAERADRAVFAEREDDAVFRIGEIEEQRLRAELLHLAHDDRTPAAVCASVNISPPGPPFSPSVWRMPYLRGTSQSSFHSRLRSIAVALTTKPAPSKAARRSVVCSTIRPAPDLSFNSLASSAVFASVCRIAADQRQRAAAQFVAAEDVAQHAQAERHAGGAEKDDLGLVRHRRPNLPRRRRRGMSRPPPLTTVIVARELFVDASSIVTVPKLEFSPSKRPSAGWSACSNQW